MKAGMADECGQRTFPESQQHERFSTSNKYKSAVQWILPNDPRDESLVLDALRADGFVGEEFMQDIQRSDGQSPSAEVRNDFLARFLQLSLSADHQQIPRLCR